MAQEATFAAGCFWSVELAFQRVPGIIKTSVGYTQGKTKDPTYEDVCSGRTGHVEAVQVEYDPSQISYKQLLEVFWKKHDPTQMNRQDHSTGRDSFHTDEQKEEAIASMKEEEAKLKKPIATEILPATTYHLAEEYHQQYLEKGVGGRKQSASKTCNDPIRCCG